MKNARPDKPSFTSWSTVGTGAGTSAGATSASALPPPTRSRLRAWNDLFSWSTLAMVVAMLLAFDFAAFFVAAAAQSTKCIEGCGLATRAHLLRQGRWVIPLTTVLPVLLALALRRQRITATVVQILVCCLLLLQNARTLQRTEDELNGKVPCWNDAYSAAECPWGDRG
jgi:hypothetical protein